MLELYDGMFNEMLEGVVVFNNPSFEGALIGITTDNRAVYDYDLMVDSYMKEKNCSEEEAVDFIELNTLRSLPNYTGSPIVVSRFEVE